MFLRYCLSSSARLSLSDLNFHFCLFGSGEGRRCCLTRVQDWEEHLYDDVFVVERVYDGPIDGWFYVEWGPVYQSDHREAARYVQCRCDPCVTPCIEDRVPEADLQRTAPQALAAYKSTALYERRLQEYELAAILRSTA